MPDPLLMMMLPESGSEFTAGVDFTFWFIFWVGAFFFVVIVLLMVLFAIRYRRKHDSDAFPQDVATHNTRLELAWSIIPTFLLILMFWWGFEAFLDMYTPPRYYEEIQVRAYGYGWEFTYPNGARTQNELLVPEDRPTVLRMTSDDFIHSFYVPEFRIKQDVVPGRWTRVWFKPRAATPAGDPGHRFYCAEYCGSGHSLMNGYVTVFSRMDYEKELEKRKSGANRVVVGTASGAGDLFKFQAGTVETLGTLEGRHSGGMTAVHINTDAGCAVSGGQGGDIALWPLTTAEDGSLGDQFGSETGENGSQAITAIVVANSGEFAFVGDASGAITAWGLVTGTQPALTKAEATAGNAGGQVQYLALVHDHLLSAGADGTLRLWSLDTTQTTNSLVTPRLAEVASVKHEGGINAAAVTNDGFVAVASDGGQAVYRIDWSAPAINAVTASFAEGAHTGPVTAIAASTASGLLTVVTGSADTNVKVWQLVDDGGTFAVTNTATDPLTGAVGKLVLSADGRFIFAAAAGDPNVLVFEIDPATGTTSAGGVIEASGPVTSLSASRSVTAIENGQKIYQGLCKSCHSIDGSDGTGPTWKGLWGAQRQVRLRDGGTTTVTVDEDYFAQSVRDPDAMLTGGPSGEVGKYAGMTAFGPDQLSGRDLADLMAFTRSLGEGEGD